MSTSRMLKVISFVQADETICKDRYRSAFVELDPILKTKSMELCGELAFERIRNYHFRFIQPVEHVNRMPTQFEAVPTNIVKQQLHPEPRKYTAEFDENDNVIMIPIAVRHFFLAYALQVSHLCKRNLALNLKEDTERLLTEEEQSIMMLFDRSTPVGQALVKGFKELDFDNVLYMKELDGVANRPTNDEFDGERKQHLKTTATHDSSVYAMALACKNKFKPIYDKLVMPIVKLSKLGYDYRGKEFDQKEKHALSGNNMQIWLGIVHVCELFENSIIIDGESVREQQLQPPEELTCSETHEGELDEISEQQAKELTDKAQKCSFTTGPIEYEQTWFATFEDKLMIAGEKNLDMELSLKPGHKNPFGFRGFLRKAAGQVKKALAKLDMERFTHYRRNSLWYAGVLNFISSCSNVASITITILSTCGMITG